MKILFLNIQISFFLNVMQMIMQPFYHFENLGMILLNVLWMFLNNSNIVKNIRWAFNLTLSLPLTGLSLIFETMLPVIRTISQLSVFLL